MVNFSRLSSGDNEKAIDPEEIFSKLVRDPSLPYLRAPQAKVLAEWYGQRERRDQVVKMNTGSGKTLVALLMLQSALNESKGPAIYLCPTRQLVTQVSERATKAGISTVQFSGSNNDLPMSYVRGQAILVATFDKVFNGKSVFGVAGGLSSPKSPPGALVIDDAHSCLSSARDQASISVSQSHGLYTRLMSLFKAVLYDQSPGTAASIDRADSTAIMAVPYWSWREAQTAVAQAIAAESETNEVMFPWPLIRDSLLACRAVFSGAGLQISPIRLPIEKVPFLDKASRRLYFSGSVVDDSTLVRDFGLSIESATTPIVPRHPGDIGERLILAPALIDSALDAEWVRALAVDVAHTHNVVVLVPSRRAAAPWATVGATVADQTNFESELESLRSSGGNLLVLVNRYDGVDLADHECRMLVIDGLPTGEGLTKSYERLALRGGSRVTADIAQRLEQGLGRGVRSNSDYCVCILGTPDVATFVVDRQCQGSLTPETAEQIQIGLDLADILVQDGGNKESAIRALIDQCLKQDRAWKEYHLQRVTSVVYLDGAGTQAATMAQAERAALLQAAGGDSLGGADIISAALTHSQVEGPDKGWHLQTKALIQDAADPIAAQQTQVAAYRANPLLLRPIHGVSHSRLDKAEMSQGERLKSFLVNFVEPRAIPLAYESILGSLAFGIDSEQFEDAAERLGESLGFRADRPEKTTKSGPDVLWYTGETFFVIECKNEVLMSRDAIAKSESSQMSSSMEWFRSNYPDKGATPVLVHPSLNLSPDAFCPSHTKILDDDGLQKLGTRVRSLAAALAHKNGDDWSVGELVSQLKSQGLHAAGGLQDYLSTPKKRK
jgi:hypothetical protein